MITSISHISTHYEMFGKSLGTGEGILVFLHGWGGTSQSLTPLAQQFATSYTCITLDLPGFGQTGNPPSHWGVSEYATFVQEWIESLSIPVSCTLVGHSFGGSVALCLASRYPHLIHNLVLCAPAWRRTQKRKVLPSNLLKRMPFLRKMIYALFFPQSDLIKYPHLEENFKLIVHTDLTNVVKTVQQNTLILWGNLDTYTPLENASILQSLMPHAKLQIFPGVRHDLPLKHIDLIVNPIQSFLHTESA